MLMKRFLYYYAERGKYINRHYGPHNYKTINLLIGNIIGDGILKKGYNKPNKQGSILTISQG